MRRSKRKCPDVNSSNEYYRTIQEACECSEDDWECDFGFHKKLNEGECVPMSDKYKCVIYHFSDSFDE